MTNKKPRFQTAYDVHERHSFDTGSESKTQQQFSEASQINNIIALHDRTGIIKNVQQGAAHYGDYSEVHEYREALDLIRQADEDFMTMPSEIRRRFNNNAGDFFEFVTNPDHGDELVAMGLANPRPSEVGDNLANTPESAPESVQTEE